MKLVFVRHGRTKSNVESRTMGRRIDDSLLDEGKAEAKAARELLRHNFSRIYTSPQKRAFDTAKIINERLRLPMEVRSEIVERDFGTLSGILWKEMSDKTDGWMSREVFGTSNEHDFSGYMGESKLDIRSRLFKFLDHVRKSHNVDERILVVTHGGVIRIMHTMLGLEVPREGIENGAPYEIEI